MWHFKAEDTIDDDLGHLSLKRALCLWANQLLRGNSLVVQWLGLHTSNAGVTGLIPGWGTKIPPAAQRGQK